jgi:hypothetical protein
VLAIPVDLLRNINQFEDSNHLGCDAMSLGEWFLMFKTTGTLQDKCTTICNVRNHSPTDMASHPRRLKFSTASLWERQISHSFICADPLKVRTLLDDHLNGGVLKWPKTRRLHLKITTGSCMMKTAVKGGERKGNKFNVYRTLYSCLYIKRQDVVTTKLSSRQTQK